MGWSQQSPWKHLDQLAQSEWLKSQVKEKPCQKQKVEDAGGLTLEVVPWPPCTNCAFLYIPPHPPQNHRKH